MHVRRGTISQRWAEGVLLVELIVSIAIFSTGLLSGVVIYQRSATLYNRTQHQRLAEHILNAEIEYLHAHPPMPGTQEKLSDPSLDERFKLLPEPEVHIVASQSEGELLKVAIELSWIDRLGTRASRRATVLIRERDGRAR